MQSAGNHTAVNDLIVIGHQALAGGLVDAGAAQTIVIGSFSLGAWVNTTPPVAHPDGPVTAIGYGIAPNVTDRMSSSVFIGDNILQHADPANTSDIAKSVVVGSIACQNIRALSTSSTNLLTNCVVIGWGALQGGSSVTQCSIDTSVIIGTEACATPNNGSQSGVINQCTVIGYQAASILGRNGTGQSNIVIGFQCAPNLATGHNNTLIGENINITGDSVSNVVIGSGSLANFATAGKNTFVGALQIANAAGQGNIALGYRAGDTFGGRNYFFTVETVDNFRQSMFLGDMSLGNIIIGNPTDAQRGLVLTPNGATNIVQIPNGSKSLSNPNTSGYFYVNAGALHWVGSGGTDTTLAPA